jgi:mannose-6-phosphate isomerase class I
MCLEGDCELEDNKLNKITLTQGETILISADTQQITIYPKTKIKLLQTFVK